MSTPQNLSGSCCGTGTCHLCPLATDDPEPCATCQGSGSIDRDVWRGGPETESMPCPDCAGDEPFDDYAAWEPLEQIP